MSLVLPEPAPASGFTRLASYPWIVVGTVCIGAFIGQVDASIVQLALPSLETAFGAPLDAVSWVAVGYVLAFAAFLPPFARLAQVLGRKSMYLGGFALFGLFSALCAVAPGLPSLIVFRCLQGASGALLGANAMVILVSAAGSEKRSRALGIQAAAQAVGLGLGPVAGGLLLTAFGWRSIFWVNVPFAALATILAWLIVPKTTAFAEDRRFDALGAIILMPALAALLLAITEARTWSLATVLMSAAAGALLLAAFAWRETRTPSPLVHLALFRSRAFSAGAVGVFVSYAMLYAMFLCMSFALVRGYLDSAAAAGLRLAIVPIALGILAPFAGALSDRRPRLIPLVGMALCVASALGLMQALAQGAAGLLNLMIGLAAFGGGLGLYIAPNNSATIAAAPPEEAAIAGGLLNLLRVIGAGVGVAASSAILSWGLEGWSEVRGRTVNVPEAAVLAAVSDVLILLVAFGLMAAAMALVRDKPKALARTAAQTAAAVARS